MILPTETYNQFIHVYDDVISDSFCSEMISKFEKSEEKFIGVTSSGLSNRKKSVELYIDPEKMEWKVIDDLLFKTYHQYAQNYLSFFPWIHFQYRDVGYFIKKYEKGKGEFKSHIDVSCKKNSYRILVMILYLNTLDKGGETMFDFMNVKISPRRGRMLIFPPMWLYPHQGKIPLSDHKYTVNTFLEFAK